MVIKNKFNQRGQTLLIVVLIMVVSLTVGLSIVSKSITNVRTTTEEANSAQALAAAEAGAQKLIQTNSSSVQTGSFTNGSIFSASSSTADISAFPIPKDEGADLWLVGHNDDGSVNYAGGRWKGNLTVYWSNSSEVCDTTSPPAALEMVVITTTNAVDPPTGAKSSKYAVDPCPSRRAKNKFDSAVSGSFPFGGKTYNFSYRLPPGGFPDIANGVVIRIVPIYANANVYATGSVPIPSQGSVISSIGKSSNNVVQRKLSVVKRYASVPIEFFTYGLFSPKK